MEHASTASRRIIFDGRQEAANKNQDRVWRRWGSFCSRGGLKTDPFLSSLRPDEQELFLRSFLGLYRTAQWSRDGKLAGSRSTPVVGSTVQNAASSLAAAFRNDNRPSPLHNQGGSHLRPVFRALIRAYDNQDPAPNRQKAITPRLLRAFYDSSGANTIALRDSAPSVTANLVLGSFFFACRACEYTKTKLPGRTKVIVLSGVIFRSATKKTIPHQHPDLLALASYVTIIFVDQKSGKKMDARTQQQTGLPFLCPVLRFVSLVQRIRRLIPTATDDTNISTIIINRSIMKITSTYVRTQLRLTCRTFGGKAVFGFDAQEIGNKSIRSGAAMSLFLTNTHTDRIMILGR